MGWRIELDPSVCHRAARCKGAESSLKILGMGHYLPVSVSNEDGKVEAGVSFLGLSGPLTKVGFEGHSVRPAGRQVASGARGSSSANAHLGGRAGDWNRC